MAYTNFNINIPLVTDDDFTPFKKDGMKIESKDYTEKNRYGDTVKYTRYKCLNVIEDRDQLGMFSNKPKEFKRWLDAPPTFNKKKHIR